MYIDHFNNSLFKSIYIQATVDLRGKNTPCNLFSKVLSYLGVQGGESTQTQVLDSKVVFPAPELRDGTQTSRGKSDSTGHRVCREGSHQISQVVLRRRKRKNASLGSTFTDVGSSLQCTCFTRPLITVFYTNTKEISNYNPSDILHYYSTVLLPVTWLHFFIYSYASKYTKQVLSHSLSRLVTVNAT